MQRISDQYAASNPPPPANPPAGPPGYFQAPNPAIGQPGTRIAAEWLNNVQETIVGPIMTSGIALLSGAYGQLTQAILRLSSSGASQISASAALTLDNAGAIQVNAQAGAVTLTLPPTTAIQGARLRYAFYRTDGSANPVTIQAGPGESINGAASVTIGPTLNLCLETAGGGIWSMLGVSSFNGRVGPVSLLLADLINALGFTPVNRSGDSMGPLTVQSLRSNGTGVFVAPSPNGVEVALQDPTRPVDEKNWGFLVSGSALYLRAINDAYTLASNAFYVLRSGYRITLIAFQVPISAPTPAPGDNSNNVSTTAYVVGAINNAVTSVNGRIGAVRLAIGDVIAALGYTPVNKAGDSMAGLTTTGLAVDGPSGSTRGIGFTTNALLRFFFYGANAANEQGANSGSDLAIDRFNDLGQKIDTILVVARRDGIFRFFYSPTVPTPIPGDNSNNVSSTAYVLAAIGNALASAVTSFNGRVGAVTLAIGDVINALGFTPVNRAGDSMGQLTVTNLIAGGGSFVANGGLGVSLKDSSRAVDEKIWDFSVYQSMFLFRAVNDAYTAATNIFGVMRAGFSVTGLTFYIPIFFQSPAVNDNSNQPATTAMLRKVSYVGRQAAAVSGIGTFNIAIPPNVTGMVFEMVAPGGAGANANLAGSTTVIAPGGGSGCFSKGYIDLTGATSVSVAFGSPGRALTGTNAGNATLTVTGGASAGQLVISGGTTGLYASNAIGQGGGFVSNTIPGPIFCFAGEAGRVGFANIYAQSVGGFGGHSRLGRAGSPSINGAVVADNGGGGAGGSYPGPSQAGSDGGNGDIIINWCGA